MSQEPASARDHRLAFGIAAMAIVVGASNLLVQFPINDWLTWGAFSYPIAFLVTDLTNRSLGAKAARTVVLVGFAFGIALSFGLAPWRIAVASGTAFLMAQLLDILIFDRLRRAPWWQAPFVSSSLASAVDTFLFFSLAFAGTAVPWQTLALGDFAVKLGLALFMLIPFRLLMRVVGSRDPAAAA